MTDIKALDILNQLGIAIGVIRSRMVSIGSYEEFMLIRKELNEKLLSLDIEVKGMINGVVYLNEKVEEYERRLSKFEGNNFEGVGKSRDKTIVINQEQTQDNKEELLITTSNNQKRFNRQDLHFNYDDYLPKNTNIPHYEGKSLENTSKVNKKDCNQQSECFLKEKATNDNSIDPNAWKSKYDLHMNYDYSEYNRFNQPSQIEENISTQSINSINNKTQTKKTEDHKKDHPHSNPNDKDKITRIQDIILKSYQNESILLHLESKYGKEFNTKITSKDVTIDFITSVEATLASYLSSNS